MSEEKKYSAKDVASAVLATAFLALLVLAVSHGAVRDYWRDEIVRLRAGYFDPVTREFIERKCSSFGLTLP